VSTTQHEIGTGDSKGEALTACPICGSQEIQSVLRISNAEAARNCLNPRRDPDRYEALRRHIAALWDREYCCICRCRVCGFGFSDPYIAGDAVFYNTAYDRKKGKYPHRKWEYDVAKEALKTTISLRAKGSVRLLEIGAGCGAFLKHVVPDLIDARNVLCTEYSDYGAAEIRNCGIHVEQIDIRDLDSTNQPPFEVVCMFQVLEHMDRISDLFGKLRAITASHADLLIAVPNSRRNQFNEENGAVLDMPPNHIGRWTKSSFEALAKQEGWRLIGYMEEPSNPIRSWQVFSIYSYARASQFDGRLSSWVAGFPPSVFRRLCELAIVAAFAIRSVALLPTLLSPGMGESVFVHLRRQG
jgi:hypothetical protein